jgi:restriction endonuclease S subunit
MLMAPSFVRRAREVMTGTKMPRIRVADLLAFQVPVPSFQEQQRIAAKLTEALGRLHALSETANEVGARINLLESAWVEHTLSQNSHRWPTATIGQVGEVAYGVTKNPARSTGRSPHRYLRVANVQRGYLDLSEVKVIDVTPDELEKWRLRAGDVLLCEGNSSDLVGRAAVFRGEIQDCVHQNHVIRVRPRAKVMLGEFLLAYLNSRVGQTYFRSKAKKTTNLATINSTEVRSMPVLVPRVEEQEGIVQQLSRIQRSSFTLGEEHAARMSLLVHTRSALLESAFQGRGQGGGQIEAPLPVHEVM